MKFSISIILLLILAPALIEFITAAKTGRKNNDGVYIVYMGAAAAANGPLRDDHFQLLSSIRRRNPNAVVHTYKHGFSGFAASLSEKEALSVAKKPGVISVFPDPILKLHTTRSWDFLLSQGFIRRKSIRAYDHPKPHCHSSFPGSDIIIGFFDSGIRPESESFSDRYMGPIPSRWKGTCMDSPNSTSSHCNRKIIGAKYYYQGTFNPFDYNSPWDKVGHGTHVAATAAGTPVANASYYGLVEGTAEGGSPCSRIAMYRVCTPDGHCNGSTMMAAFDDAIYDGVDIISISLGADASKRPKFHDDPIALGSFHAVEQGITVVCSAGNNGPTPGTAMNVAPWIITVAASTIDRDFQSYLVLGNGKVMRGESINFSPLERVPEYPLINAESAMKDGAYITDARNCVGNSMDGAKVKGKIVVCNNDIINDQRYSIGNKIGNVTRLGGIGIVLVDDRLRAVANTYASFPFTVISSHDAARLLSYINNPSPFRDAVATILPTVALSNHKHSPVIPYFSSRGPSFDTKNILKPDITAPGVDILAAWIANDTSTVPQGQEPSLFNIISGTSMACPHISGLAAIIKSKHPTWSPSAIRSAIMTTATRMDNLGGPIKTDVGIPATPYDYGAGEATIMGALQPGLVYETSFLEYLNYLCYNGFEPSSIKGISKSVPDDFNCPQDSDADYISNINYPSIAISKFKGEVGRKISRTVTHVGGDGESVYSVIVDGPKEIKVEVIPEKLIFTKNDEKHSYQVVFSSANAITSLNKDVFGSVTWTSGQYKVRSAFVVSSS